MSIVYFLNLMTIIGLLSFVNDCETCLMVDKKIQTKVVWVFWKRKNSLWNFIFVIFIIPRVEKRESNI